MDDTAGLGEVLLADVFCERAGTHAVGKGGVGDGCGIKHEVIVYLK